MTTLTGNLKSLVGEADLLMVTLDTLRFDAAQAAFHDGRLTTLAPYLGNNGWERRHSPASFTYAAHHAFFAGFLPTPEQPGSHSRLFASRFGGSETCTEETFLFDEATLPEALSARDYHTICIGGTGFFNPNNALGRVLPELFDESHFTPQLGVADRQSEINQVALAAERLGETNDRLAMVFVNVAAIHQPNWFYGNSNSTKPAGKDRTDTLATHTDALVAVDQALAPLFELCQKRRPTFCVICSDHGTAYGEGGHFGHRLAHEVVWNVPYAEFLI